jgi:hypothetical protein
MYQAYKSNMPLSRGNCWISGTLADTHEESARLARERTMVWSNVFISNNPPAEVGETRKNAK